MKRGLVAIGMVAGIVMIPHPADARSQGHMVVIGDSISEKSFWAERGGKSDKIWWSKLSRKTHYTPEVYAQRGSGYTHKGKCTSTTFEERVSGHKKNLEKAKVVIIAGGVNDWRECNDSGKLAVINSEKRLELIQLTLQQVDDAVTDNSKVIVTVPWGTLERIESYREEITTQVRDTALAHGFVYVDTAHGVLKKGRTRDGVHPNDIGSQAIYRQIYNKSFLKK